MQIFIINIDKIIIRKIITLYYFVYKQFIETIEWRIRKKMDETNDFVVVLPSNSVNSNTPAKFITTFDNPIFLNGGWEVALLEVNFKNSIKSIHNDSIQVIQSYTETTTCENKITNLCELPFGEKQKDGSVNISWSSTTTRKLILFDDGNGRKVILHYEANDPHKNKLIIENLTKFPLNVYMKGFYSTLFAISTVDPTGTIHFKVSPMETYETSNPHSLVTLNKKQVYPIQLNDKQQLPWLELRYDAIKTKELCKVLPKEGTYSSAIDLVTEINRGLEKFKFEFNPRINRILLKSLDTTINTTLHLNNGLNDVLGFNKTTFSGKQEFYQGEMEVNLMRGISSVFIYCDLCEFIRVGNKHAPLLRNVAFNATKYGEMVHVNYNNPIYIPLCKSFIDSIEITLRDAKGDIIPFIEGLTTCLLHFKRL